MRFTVGKKIGLGFGIVLILLLTVFGVTLFVVNEAEETLGSSIDSNDKLLKVDKPSVYELIHLKHELTNVHLFMTKWTFLEDKAEVVYKTEACKLIDALIPRDTVKINKLANKWEKNNNDKKTYDGLKLKIAELLIFYNVDIREMLPEMLSYGDDFLVFSARTQFDIVIEPLFLEIMQTLDELIDNKNTIAQVQQQESNSSFETTNSNFQILSLGVFLAGIILALGTIIIALFTTTSITKPVHELKKILLDLGRGVFPKNKISPSNDEIGEMSTAMNSLVSGLQKTTSFAHEVGQSNFKYPYEPLSDEDVLGHALLKMKDELAETEMILEKKVEERTEEVVRQKDEIEDQRLKLEDLYKDVTDSIRYAKRLQYSILPPDVVKNTLFPSSFVLFKPKDIVSGDFYWMYKIGNKHLFASVDCTGHGVPGAFMSLVGANGLNSAVKEHALHTPGEILDDLNKYAHESLYKKDDENAVRDGMDIALCALDYDNMNVEFSGAYNPLYIIRKGEILITKGDKFAIGSFDPGSKNYETHNIPIKKGDLLYVFSDGYADQFGGLKGKKFMYRQFRDTLLSIKDMPMDEQKQVLDQKIETWKGSYEQVDDILIIGVHIN